MLAYQLLCLTYKKLYRQVYRAYIIVKDIGMIAINLSREYTLI